MSDFRDEPPAASVNIVPVPIRPDLVAQVLVPFDLTKAEARKIGAVLLALAKDEDPAHDNG